MRGNGATGRERREIHRKRGGVDRETARGGGGVKEAKSEKDRERNKVSLSSILTVVENPQSTIQSVTFNSQSVTI